jgi:multidrug efflux pump
VRAALSAANAHSPKGSIDVAERRYQIYNNDQAVKADQYRSLVVAYRNGAPVRLSDVGEVIDSVENLRNAGLANGKPAVLVILYRQPGANIIDTVDRVIALLPQLRASISPAIDTVVAVDRSTTIRASLHDVEVTLIISIILVTIVVLAFLRDPLATFVPSIAVPISLLGTLAVMYLLGYSLDNLSLMALTISTGFVVDDAIVVVENISRYIESGMSRIEAAIKGAAEVSFTVLSMSLSLIAVFIPILLMGGIVGRLFREFAVTLSVAILVSLMVSLTTTPMMSARLLGRRQRERNGRFFRASERLFSGMLGGYERTLGWALQHARIVMLILLITVCLNIYLFIVIPKVSFRSRIPGG